MHIRTRIKICGISSLEMARQAVAAGADALGFMFYSGSSRFVEPKVAGDIIRHLPPYVETVGVFVNASVSEVESALNDATVKLLQFHGEETPEYCQAFSRRFVKVFKGGDEGNLVAEAGRYKESEAVMLDSVSAGQFGGTGETFDWQTIPDFGRPLILAGGLNAENVQNAIRQVRPYAVDVSGGVERTRGVKDAALMEKFVLAVQKADRSE